MYYGAVVEDLLSRLSETIERSPLQNDFELQTAMRKFVGSILKCERRSRSGSISWFSYKRMSERNSCPSYRGQPPAAGIVMIVVAKDVGPMASELVVTNDSSWR